MNGLHLQMAPERALLLMKKMKLLGTAGRMQAFAHTVLRSLVKAEEEKSSCLQRPPLEQHCEDKRPWPTLSMLFGSRRKRADRPQRGTA